VLKRSAEGQGRGKRVRNTVYRNGEQVTPARGGLCEVNSLKPPAPPLTMQANQMGKPAFDGVFRLYPLSLRGGIVTPAEGGRVEGRFERTGGDFYEAAAGAAGYPVRGQGKIIFASAVAWA
jgi:hypothetical protein